MHFMLLGSQTDAYFHLQKPCQTVATLLVLPDSLGTEPRMVGHRAQLKDPRRSVMPPFWVTVATNTRRVPPPSPALDRLLPADPHVG
ncbi:hypothetical protein ATANTOWER_019162 [Ataeniobius toweri]|uniref:Uncharacterized protein n=1 Tax=Ataeniobius toweri TaxID=208326 RepID=A0ABU7A943_9TELE|nr:hypothetical protein [Ataeniobius toweri]